MRTSKYILKEINTMKKTARYLMTLMIALMCLILTACGNHTASGGSAAVKGGRGTMKVDLAPYLSVAYSGCDGEGSARVDFDFADMEYAIMSQWEGKDQMEKLAQLTAVEMTIIYRADVSEGLSNGDTVTVKISLDKDLAKEYGYSFTGLERQFTVEGLTEAIEIDPFAEDIFGEGRVVNVTLEGIDPFVSLTIRNTATLGEPIRGITYRADKDWELKNGDVITVTASLDKRFQQQGYVLSRTEFTITVEGFDRYASAPSDLTQEVLRQIADRAYQECLWGNSVEIYDGRSNKTPWGAEILNIHVADTALLAVNRQIDNEYSFLLVPVYKTITTDEWYDMDSGTHMTMTWTDVVGYYKFSDVIVHPDGSVSYYEYYVDMKGNYTDSAVADTLYLNELRSRYDFAEVPMP